MNQEQAAKLLGVSSDATPAKIQEAYEAKRKQAESLQEKAPTDALKTKYEAMLGHLSKAKNLLVQAAEATSAEEPSAAEAPQQEAPKHQRPDFTKSMYDDLPSADPRNTRMGDDGKVELNITEGTILAGRYKIEEFVAAGGMGAVYRALDANTGEHIAVKVMLPALLRNEKAKERFMDEARISQKLSHPNVVNVFDVQQDGEFFFLTMELLEGQDLRQVMVNRKNAQQTFDVDEVKDIIAKVSEGLKYAHQHTVHRDIKPENIWLTDDGDCKIMDFGIARIQSTSQRSQSGAVLGTAYYMAPEQLRGAKDIDGRADQYAMGVLAYEMLTGEVPAGMIEPIRTLRKDVKKGLADAIHRSLSPKPDARYGNIEEFNAAVQKSKGGVDISIPWKPVGIAAGVLMLVGALGFAATTGNVGGVKELWDAIRPYSEEEVIAFQAEGARVEGIVKTTERRMNEFRSQIEDAIRENQFTIRQLNSELSRASSSKKASLNKEIADLELLIEDLRTQKDLLRDYVVESDKLGELSGQLSLAKALLTDKKYKKSAEAFAKVSEGYEQLSQSLDPSESLAHYYNKTKVEKANWEKLERDMKPGTIPFAEELDASYSEGLGEMENTEFLNAAGRFETLATDYARLSKALTEGSQHKAKATKNKASWEKYASSNSLKTNYTQQYANYFGEAMGQWQAGNIVPASESFELLHKDYAQLEDAARNSKAYSSRARTAQRNWHNYAKSNKLSISLTGKYDKEYKQAENSLKNGDLVDSAKKFAELANSYSSLHNTAKKMLSAQSSAYSARNTWNSHVNKGWARSNTGKSAESLYTLAFNEKKAGSWSKATDTFAQAKNNFSSLSKKSQNNRNAYNNKVAAWEKDLNKYKSDVSKYEDRVSSYSKNMRSYSGKMNTNCSKGSGWGAASVGISSASCEMGCNKQVWNGMYYESRTDQYCVNNCRNQANRAMAEQRRKIERCESEVSKARDRYRSAERDKNSAQKDLRSAKNNLSSKRNSKPEFSPI